MHLSRFNSTREWHCPIDSGSSVNALSSLRESLVNFLRLPISAGIFSKVLHLSKTSSSKFSRRVRLSGRFLIHLLWCPEFPLNTSLRRLSNSKKRSVGKSMQHALHTRQQTIQLDLPLQITNRFRQLADVRRVGHVQLQREHNGEINFVSARLRSTISFSNLLVTNLLTYLFQVFEPAQIGGKAFQTHTSSQGQLFQPAKSSD